MTQFVLPCRPRYFSYLVLVYYPFLVFEVYTTHVVLSHIVAPSPSGFPNILSHSLFSGVTVRFGQVKMHQIELEIHSSYVSILVPDLFQVFPRLCSLVWGMRLQGQLTHRMSRAPGDSVDLLARMPPFVLVGALSEPPYSETTPSLILDIFLCYPGFTRVTRIFYLVLMG